MGHGQIVVGEGSLSTGFEYQEEKIVMITDSDIFANAKIRRSKPVNKDAKPIKAFTDLKPGDYVVHENHGIGRYLGIEQLDIQKTKKDYFKIKYAGEDMLYVPVEQMNLVQKYIGADSGIPRINKLSSGEWKKTKAKAKGAIVDMAKELLQLSAIRNSSKGYSFSQDTTWQTEFEDAFPYEETGDQLKCAEEIKRDMQKDIPMDRLLCGDVGYGKTEVAARAVFKCVVDGKQAAVLVPTTILANQHYTTFRERFGKFPFNIEMLSRFRTDKEQRQIIKKVEDGSIDILVGTHRLLSEDIKFKDLGLLIIDEEQKFGVQHKEVIKRMKKNVDVLTLSATPIPRTLHMSLIGLRDMSTIEDPPEERFPVQTFVIEYEEEIIKEAIIREYERGGQVFFVYNRVRGIRRISAHLQELVPDVSIAVAHGQMNEKELENIMISFMNRKYDVLVCTTIIESGIDIQNTNTIIIYDADKFGLSQLYQLRGRVGRSNRMAYAYFAYQKDKVLTEQSEKRLKAIKEFTEFGSGFKIAMRDLEIRGAGNLLGVEQHGHLVTIGYELYCKLLDETVRELKGETFIRHDEVSIEIETNAYIPKQYIQDEITKVEVYKRIASIRSKDEMPEIEDELVDRFGEFPVEMYNLIKIAYIKFLAEVAGISRIREDKGRITFEFHENNVLKPYLINGLALKYGTRIHINAGERPFIKFSYRQFNSRLNELILFMEEIIELHSSERRFNQND
jgi:transcription-repair coupling factor (superfamily II helicase)